ncbi:MAG: TolC family protein [candidate division Zixibacteria bacterium]|nr:TolC family protein [candidate division Zixibacteria bacterium]
MKYRVAIHFMTLLMTVLSSVSFSQRNDQLPVVNIGIVIDGPWERNTEIGDLFKNEIVGLLHGEFDVRFPEDKQIVADWTAEGIRKAVDRLLTDRETDLVLALGVIASFQVSHLDDISKPVIAPFLIDAALQGLVPEKGTSGIKNLNYVSFPSPTKINTEMFLTIVPFEKLAVLVNRHYCEAIPVLEKRTEGVLTEMGLDPEIIPVGSSVDEAWRELPADVEAVHVLPMTQFLPGEFDRLAAGLIERKLPSFSHLGRSEVEQGIMAGLQTDFFPKIARRVALNVQRILLGEEPGSIPVAFAPRTQLTINMATARAIGVSPSWAVLTEAELIEEERKEIKRQLDFYSATKEAIAVNLDLAAKERFVAAGSQNVNEAWSNLMPQVSLSGLGTVIDKDRAEASFGQQAERTLSGSATATQVIFSEPAWTNISIQKNIQKTREQELARLRLDIAQAAATAYLNVLKAKTFERIQKENLKKTRSNLEMARVREVVGTAGPAEVYRWESEIANNRKTVIQANSQRNQAEIQLNTLLHRPAEEHFSTKETTLDDPALIGVQGRLFRYMGDPQSFKLLRIFMVEEGLRNSPELTGLDAYIAAQKRVLSSTTHSFWSPTIAVQGKVSQLFSEEGAGSDGGLDLPLGSFSLPEADDTDWSVGLNVSFDLFKGGEKFAARAKAKQEFKQLELERQALAERIEQRIRSALHQAGASHAGIHQSRLSAGAANKSLEVVEDAYARGVVSILDLLDAQNAALVADLGAANAVYDFLIDLMEVERAIGQFEFFLSPEERKSAIKRLEDYFEKATTQ